MRKVFEIVKRFGFFETSVYCKLSKNLKGDPLKTKKFERKDKEAQFLKYALDK